MDFCDIHHLQQKRTGMLQRTKSHYPWSNCSYGHATTKNEMCRHTTPDNFNRIRLRRLKEYDQWRLMEIQSSDTGAKSNWKHW